MTGSSWLENYEALFTTDTLVTAIKNNAIWVGVVPALVTAIGLIFAVLTERIRWTTAFKIAVFMPMAISLFAAGVIWRLMYEHDPDRGTINAAMRVVDDAVSPNGVLTAAQPSTPTLVGSTKRGFVLQNACTSRPAGAARPDRDPARRAARRRGSGRDPALDSGRRRRGSSGATSGREAARRARSSRRSWGSPGSPSNCATRRAGRSRRRRPPTTAASASPA